MTEKYTAPPWLEKILGPGDRAAAETKRLAKEKLKSPTLAERFKKRIARWLSAFPAMGEKPATSHYKYSQRQLKKLEKE